MFSSILKSAGCCAVALMALTTEPARADEVSTAAVLNNYADIAEASFADSLTTAKVMQQAIAEMIKNPTAGTLKAARDAWVAARVPYQQTEAFRFGNKIVDDWEGRVNSWPLDEGLIDYVAGEYGTESAENELYVANVIANKKIKLKGDIIDATEITPALLADKLQEGGGIEANVATGYHAIEFLLWGQDLNGTGPGAGNRPVTDYDTKACTGGNCDRRIAYLNAATDLLIQDLAWMTEQWKPGGQARKDLEKTALVAVFTGLGSLSYGELAGERMKLGLLIHDPEEEHDCFSDDTHNAQYYDALGIENVYLGRYKRVDGSVVEGPSPSDLVKAANPAVDKRMRDALDRTMAAMTALVERAKTVEAYDQMIAEGNTEGNATIEACVTALLAQTKDIQRAINVLNLKAVAIQGSASLDNPAEVGK